MTFYDEIVKYRDFNPVIFSRGTTDDDFHRALTIPHKTAFDLLHLISPAGEKHIEFLASKAAEATIRYFGYTMGIYAPLYLSNYCENQCVYCGYNCSNPIKRGRLEIADIAAEMDAMTHMGIRQVLLLTGECRIKSDVEYICEAVRMGAERFDSVNVEVYPMETEEYRQITDSGAEGLTLYQETYDPILYDKLHIKGKKKDYRYRLDAPERGIIGGFRRMGLGPLYGLGDPYYDIFFNALHLEYLYGRYRDVEYSLSLPRMNGNFAGYDPSNRPSDLKYVQMITALRIVYPWVGITISTRESPFIRDNLIGLGITKMSAGSKTTVGGYADENGGSTPDGQFDISDERGVGEIVEALSGRGYEAVFKDWERI